MSPRGGSDLTHGVSGAHPSDFSPPRWRLRIENASRLTPAEILILLRNCGQCGLPMPIDTGPDLLRDWIARAAQRDPGKPWLVCADGGRTISYGELHAVAGRIATLLHERGIGANHRVALLANNSIEHPSS